MNGYARANIEIIIRNEGGRSLNPKDYGNWTKYHQQDCGFPLKHTSEKCLSCRKCLLGTNRGIATRYWEGKYDVMKMTLNDTYNFYYHEYWLKQNVSFLMNAYNENFILQLFDFGVNTNPYFSNRKLQRIIGASPDGLIGKETLAKTISYKGNLLEDFKQARRDFYTNQAKKEYNKEFLEGWLKRVDYTHF